MLALKGGGLKGTRLSTRWSGSEVADFLFSQNAPVTLAWRWTPAAAPRGSAAAGPTSAARHVTSVPPVTTVTPAARVGLRSD